MNPFFIKSCASIKDWPNDDIKEICLIGRSNVGKSSIINALANSKIAKTSNTPGRTQLANFYSFDQYRIVDLPGYGYAKVNKKKQFELSKIISEYIYMRKNIEAVFQIVDISVITDLDIQMSKIVSKRFVNHFIIFNKIDKQNKSYFKNNKQKLLNCFDKDESHVLSISSKEKINILDLKKKISEVVK